MKNNEIIDCVDSVYFLGKTNSHIFILYPNAIDNYSKTRVINVSDVQEINVFNVVRWYKVIP